MKPIAAILFLSVVLVNLGGYQLITNYRQSCANTELEHRLDEGQYDDADLISIKTPLNLPYYTSSETFERVTGTINVKGTTYKYVKRRVYNDTLEVLCIKDGKATKIMQAATDFFKFNTGLPGQKKSLSNTKLLFFDYCNALQKYNLTALSASQRCYQNLFLQYPPNATISCIEQPPDA